MGKSAYVKSFLCVLLVLTITAQSAWGAATAQVAPTPRQTSIQVNISGPMGLEINSFNGNLYHSRADLSLPSRGLPITISLAYNSGQSGIDEGYGYGWQFNYDLYYGYDGQDVLIFRSDGRVDRFVWDGSELIAPAGVRDTLGEYAPGQYRLISPQGITTYFDAPDHQHVTRIEDPNGNALSFTYSGGQLSAVHDASGRQVTFAWADGHLATITDPNPTPNRTVQLVYDATDNLTTITDPGGNVTHYSYDGHFITGITDPRGNTAAITYNGRAVSGISAASTSLTVAYDSVARTTTATAVVNGVNQVTGYVYDAQGRISTIQDALGHNISMVWDANNHLSSYTDQNGHTTAYTYDAQGNVLTVTDPSGRMTTYTYESVYNNVTSIHEANGHTITYGYDARGNLTSTLDPLGHQTTFGYDTQGNMVSTTDANGHTTSYAYNAYGDMVSATDPLGHATTFGYDAVGNMIASTDALSQTSTFTYDAQTHLLSSFNPLSQATGFTYDANGNLASITDARGSTTAYTFDALNQLIQVTDAAGNVTAYTYDEAGNLRTITDAEGHVTTRSYDAGNRLISETDGAGQTTSYTYDPAGNLLTRTDANGATTTYAYDAADRLTTITYPGGATITYTYDNADNLTAVTSPLVSATRSYDDANRLTSVSVTVGGITKTISYAYDAAGNRIAMTDPDGGVTSYIYDAANRLTSLVNPSSQTTSYTYDAANRLIRKDLGNGTYSQFAHDAANRLLSVTTHDTGGAVLFGATYVLDAVGNRTRATDASGAQTGFAYDMLNRLTGVTLPGGGTISYSYDRVGNRVQTVASGSTTSYAYDAADCLLSAGIATYGWDNNSNQISRTDGSGTTTYTYDTENRLTGVALPGGTTNAFTYYPDGRRLSKTDGAGVTTVYFYDGDNVLLETDAGGATQARYTSGLATDDWLSMSRAGTTYTYHQDGLGSIVGLTDPTETVAATYQYDPFGVITGETGSVVNPLRYTGREYDPDSGLYYLRARYYDPTTGRFVSKDLARGNSRNPLSLNRFIYAQNNPLKYVDPSGRVVVEATVAGAVIGGGMAAAFNIMERSNNGESLQDIVMSNEFWAETAGGAASGAISMALMFVPITKTCPVLADIASGVGSEVAKAGVRSLATGHFELKKEDVLLSVGTSVASGIFTRYLPGVRGRLPGSVPGWLNIAGENSKHAFDLLAKTYIGKSFEFLLEKFLNPDEVYGYEEISGFGALLGNIGGTYASGGGGWGPDAPIYLAPGDVYGLTAAIRSANISSDHNTISLTPGSVYTLVQALPAISTSLTISGNGATISGGGTRIFYIDTPGVAVVITDLHLVDGFQGIRNRGILALDHVDISGNTGAYLGAGIWNSGSVEITSSTISNNTAQCHTECILGNCYCVEGNGGALYNDGGIVSIFNSTLSNNVGVLGGGIMNQSAGTVEISNSTLYQNTTSGSNPSDAIYNGNDSSISIKNSIVATLLGDGNCTLATTGAFTPLGENLSSDATCTGFTINSTNPLLNDLREAGGDTLTNTLAGPPIPSAAVDAVTDCTDIDGNPVTVDQRGYPRQIDGLGEGTNHCDLGAVEFDPASEVTRTLTVTDPGDSGPGTLRQAIADAHHNDTIEFSNVDTVSLQSQLVIRKNLFIQGPGADQLTISGNGSISLFYIDTFGVTVNFAGVHVANGLQGIRNKGNVILQESIVSNNVGAYRGAGIWNTGNVEIRSSTISDNTAQCHDSCILGSCYCEEGYGGGVYNEGGTVSVTNSTLSSNTASAGGGIFNTSSGLLSLSSSTLYRNYASGDGDGVYNSPNSSLTSKNSIIASASAGDNCFLYTGGTFTAVGENLSSDTTCTDFSIQNVNPLLNELRNTGGATPTNTLAGPPIPSAAIDAVTDCTDTDDNPVTVDQRGYARPIDGLGGGTNQCDIGAIEYDPVNDAPTVITVTNLDDSGPGSLRQAIADAHHNDTIEFDVTGVILLESKLIIDKNLFINGPGATDLTISGNDVTRVMEVVTPGTTVTLEGLTIANANGTGIYNKANLILSDCAVRDNTDAYYGGILNYSGASLTLINTTVSGNHATAPSGYAYAGGIYNSNGTLTLINSTVSGNSAAYGGGINANGTVSISNSTIYNNTGTGIYVNSGAVTVKNSIIGSPSGYGTCYVKTGATFTALGENLSSDQNCPGFTIIKMDPVLNPLGDYGGPTETHTLVGPPYPSQAIDAVTDCTAIDGSPITTDQRGYTRPVDGLDSGTAQCDLGAVEYVATDSNPQTWVVTNLDDSGPGSLRQAVADAQHNDTIRFEVTGTIALQSKLIFSKNVILDGPGADQLTLSGGNLTRVLEISRGGITVVINGLTIADGNAGGIFSNGILYLRDCAILNNTDYNYGGIYNGTAGTLTIISSTLSGNRSTASSARYAGAIYNIGSVTIINSTLSGNSATYGGGIYNAGSGSSVSVSQSTIYNNTGKGIYVDSGTVTVKNSIVSSPTTNSSCYINASATFTALEANLSSDQTCAGFTITTTDPLLNPLQNNGGPTDTHTLAGLPYPSQAMDAATDCTAIDGSPITIDQRGYTRPVDGLEIGTAQCDLGAVEYRASDSNPQTLIVTNLNDAGPGSLRQVIADAHHNDTIRLDVNGVIQLASDLTINKNLTIVGPGADVLTISGGANIGTLVNAPGLTVEISGLTFANSAGQRALTNSGILAVHDCAFVNNISTAGALQNTATGILHVVSSTFTGNSTTYGGAIYNQGTLTILNSTLSDNVATYGEDIYNAAGQAFISHTTIWEEAGDEGLYVAGGTVTVKNSIVAKRATSGYNCVISAGATLIAVGENLSSDATCAGFSVLSANPLLNRLENTGGTLPTRTLAIPPYQSPAIDAATDCTDLDGHPVNVDQRGVARPHGGDCDLGAVEYDPALQPPETFTVTTLADSGEGSLRQAVLDAHQSATVYLAASGTIQLASDFNIDKNLTIVGPGADALTIRGGSGIGTTIILPGVTVEISGLTFANSASQRALTNSGTLIVRDCAFVNNSSSAGALQNNTTGTLEIYNSTFSGNSASNGGAIYNQGMLIVLNSTLSDNAATYGEDIYNASGQAYISHTTIFEDVGDEGLYINAGTVTIKNSIIAKTPATGSNCVIKAGATLTAVGENLSSDATCTGFGLASTNPLLGALQNNGGSTNTRALLTGSPAIDAVTACTDTSDEPVTQDQRATPRPQGSACDIGAYEWALDPPSAPSDAIPSPLSDTQIDLSWIDNSTDETAFHIERSSNGLVDWTEIATVGSDEVAYQDTGLTCGTTYFYRVRAYRSSDGQYSAYSNTASASTAPCPPPTAPTALLATGVSHTQIDLTWTDNALDETDFYIEQSSDGTTGWAEIGTTAADQTAYQDPELNCGTAYYYRVRAYRSSDGQFSDYSNVADASTVACPPVAPTMLVATGVSHSQIDLTWTDNSFDESEFRIEHLPDGTTNWTEIGIVGSDQTVYQNIGLNCGTMHYYRVRAYRTGDGQFSAYSNVTDAGTVACSPAAPTALLATPASLNQIDLSWLDNADDETDFRIERSLAGVASWVEIGVVAADQTGYQDTALTCGTAYDYRVRAYRSSDEQYSDYSNVTSASTPACPPLAAPTSLVADATSPNQVNLVWTDNSSDETAFRIERSPNGVADWAEVGAVGADETTYQEASLTCNTAYDYRVRAYRSSDGQFSTYSNTASVITSLCAPALLAPVDGALTNDNTPTFTWRAVIGAVMYRIQVDDDPAFGSAAVDAVVNATTYTPVAPLAESVLYSWRVQAIDGGGHSSPWSNAWHFSIDPLRLAAPGLSNPKDHTYTKDTTPTFTWKNVKGAVNFEFQLSDDYGFSSTLADVETLTARTYTLPVGSELDYGVYYWRVRAQDAAGRWSDWSYINTLTITILSSPKNATHLTDTTPTLQWQSVGLGVLYEVQVDEIGGDFSIPVFTYSGTAKSIASTELAGGDYQWRAHSDMGSGWSVWTPVWTFTITPPTTIAPKLISPANYAKLDTTTPDFEWEAVPNGVTYQIQIATNSNFKTPTQDVTLDPGVLSYTADPLADGGKYFWRVRAINVEGVAGAWSAKWQFTLNQLVKPVQISPLTGTQTTDTTPTLTWNPVIDAVSYEVQIDKDNKFGTPDQVLTTSTTSVTANPALPDGKYYWRMRAVNAFNVTGLWSAVWNVTIDTTGPDQPVLKTPADRAGTADTTPTLEWKSAKTAKQYHVVVASDPGFAHIEVEVTVGSTSYTVQPGEALGYGLHYWQVQAADALGNWGGWSTPFQFALTNMTSPKDSTTTTATQPTFTWAAVAGALSYQFELDNNADFSSPEGAYSGTNRSYKPPLPLDAGTYYWHVSVDGGAWMPTWTVVITAAKPAKPVLSNPANNALFNDNTPLLAWLTTLNANTYQIQVDNNTDFSSPEQDVTVGVDLLTYVSGELAEGKYFWHVRAFNVDGAPGPWSAKWSFTIDTVPTATPILLAPIDGAVSTNKMLKLTWNKVEGASAYELQLDTDPAFPLPVISAANKTTYTPPTPLSRGVYHWQVRALDKAGNASAWSDAWSFEIVAGVTAPGIETPTPVPTEPPAPTVVPTAEPTAEPTVEPTEEPTEEPTIITPEPTVEPTVEPPQPPDTGLPTVTLPVSETFDSKAGWQAKGVWKFGKNAGQSGGGYFADSTRRGVTSVLVAPVLIDLTSAQAPTLHFTQRMGLSSGDLVAVDVSLDGGQTWQPLDQQRGHNAQWAERTVDLSAYRGQVIRLRFRLDTRGRVPQGEKSRGWWIDTISVQEV